MSGLAIRFHYFSHGSTYNELLISYNICTCSPETENIATYSYVAYNTKVCMIKYTPNLGLGTVTGTRSLKREPT